MHSGRKSGTLRGFTLMEIAIVLAVAGIILGAVVVASGGVQTKSNIYRVSQQVLQVAQNIREQYVGAMFPSTWGNATAEITTTLDGVNVFPLEMRGNRSLAPGDAAQTINHALASSASGTFRVFFVKILASATGVVPAPASGLCSNLPCFRILLTKLNPDTCINIAKNIPMPDATVGQNELGILQLGVVNATAGSTCETPTAAVCTTTTTPTITQLAAWCGDGEGKNSLAFDFKLHN